MERRKCTTVRQLELMIEFLEDHRDLALGRVRSKEARALSARLWRECAEILNAEGPARTGKEWARVWNDNKSKVRAKLISINASQRATGGGPSNAPMLTALEDRVANILGKDIGPLSGVRQDQFTTNDDNADVVLEPVEGHEEHTQYLQIASSEIVTNQKCERKKARACHTCSNTMMSTLLFWQGKGKTNGAPNGRNWIHAPDALVKGHVAYLVKFLGCTPVDQPKGIEVVKDAIKKLQFSQQLRKSQDKDNAKCKKVEITVSVDGVAIQEPRSNNILYQFPLHRISYCADDKGAKKYFSFIAKNANTSSNYNGHDESKEKHECFVFISTKLASEITLTIGQAFDLAYKRFLNDNGKYIEMQKLSLQNKRLELQMNAYKNRLQELSKITYKDDLSSYLARNNLSEITEFKTPADLEKQIATLTLANGFSAMNGFKPEAVEKGADAVSNNSSDTFNSNDNNLLLSTPPPMHNDKLNFSTGKAIGHLSTNKNPVVGPKLEELIFHSDSDSDFDPRAFESDTAPRYSSPLSEPAATPTPPMLAPPPKASRRQTTPQPQPAVNGNDLFGSAPFAMPQQTIQAADNSPFNLSNSNSPSKPNYNISDFQLQTSVFNNTSFTNGLSGYDPFETQKTNNIFANGFGNAFNGFGNLSDKQNVELNSSFNGFLDKTISDMKDGFSRGLSFGNVDFSIDNLDPLKKN